MENHSLKSCWGDPTFWKALESTSPLEEQEPTPSWQTGSVYFAHAPDLKRVKIGYTTNWKRRRPELKHEASGFPIELIGFLNGGRQLERIMHERFADQRIAGEWFHDTILDEAQTLVGADEQFYGAKAA